MLDIYEVIGLVGTFLYLLSYAILQYHRDFSHDARYWLMNLLATSCLLYSLYFYWNIAAFIGNITWFIISAVGAVRSMRSYRSTAPVIAKVPSEGKSVK